jgi:hypothetical protein
LPLSGQLLFFFGAMARLKNAGITQRTQLKWREVKTPTTQQQELI